MKENLNFTEQAIGAAVRRGHQVTPEQAVKEMGDLLNLKGVFNVEHYRNGRIIGNYEAPNTITNVGKNYILDVMFNGGTQIVNASWFMGFITSTSFSAIAAADTMASHAGWAELTGYSQSTRQAWGSGAAASQSTTNATAVTIDITGTFTVKGLFITSNSTKSGTTGTLWSAALFSSGDVSVINGDQLRSTYTLSA